MYHPEKKGVWKPPKRLRNPNYNKINLIFLSSLKDPMLPNT